MPQQRQSGIQNSRSVGITIHTTETNNTSMIMKLCNTCKETLYKPKNIVKVIWNIV